MKNKNTDKNNTYNIENDIFSGNESVVSQTECTGLVAAAPTSEEEVKAYCQIYDIPLSDDKDHKNHNRQSIKPSENKNK